MSKTNTATIFVLYLVCLGSFTNFCLSLKCYKKTELLNGTPQMNVLKAKFERFNRIAQTPDPNGNEDDLLYYLGGGSFGQVFYDPEKPAQAIKMIDTNDKDEIKDTVKEIQTCEKMSKLDAKYGTYRVAPKFFEAYCYIGSTYHFYIVQERFLSALDDAAMEVPDFSYRMKSFSNRMAFYQKLINAFFLIYSKGYKHCDVKPANMFLGYNGMFEDSAEDEEEQIISQPKEYFPVFADFGLTVKTSESCPGGSASYIDPGEMKDILPAQARFRERIEMFSLSLSILEIETLFFYKWFIRDHFISNQNWVPSWVGVITPPDIIQHDINNMSKPKPFYNLKYLFKETLDRVGNFNKKKGYNYSFEKLKEEVTFYANILLHYNDLANQDKMDIVNMPSTGERTTVFHANRQIYQKFLNMLIGMLTDNSIVNGRPSMSESINHIDQAAEESAQLDAIAKQALKNAFSKPQSPTKQKRGCIKLFLL